MVGYISPRASRLIVRKEVNPIESLDGIVLGLFHNSKPNADDLLESVLVALRERVIIRDVVRDSKPVPSSPADYEAVRSMADACGAVIFATAD
ncbi:MAG: hypothetical protein OEM40_06345 [Acidimicrobiia bacterium]|nr:hypothetical protein [Acidimicrobiia bacterium]